jgi:hypothetical protein
MNEQFGLELWDLFKEYVDRRHLSVVADKYISLLTDLGFSDETLEEMLGHDSELDKVIYEMLDIDDVDIDSNDE